MITQQKLMEELHYNENTGVFTRLKTRTSAKKGTVAGGVSGKGYIDIRLFGKRHKAHRLAFLYTHGYMPEQVDHINHDKQDNRICNLRDSNNIENCMNRTKYKSNKSGVAGVSWHKRDKVWTAQIKVNFRQINLGSFMNKEDAVLARQEAEVLYGFHTNHGKDL
jgi:hypothetical protein